MRTPHTREASGPTNRGLARFASAYPVGGTNNCIGLGAILILSPKSGLGLGRVETALKEVGSGSQEPRVSQAAIAAISGLIPTMFMTRVRLYARTERAISAATFGRVLVRKCSMVSVTTNAEKRK